MSATSSLLPVDLSAWLDANADSLDSDSTLAADLLPRLTDADLARAGVPQTLDGSGGDVTTGVDAIAAVSERSLAAGFVLWGHRSYIEYLLQSPNVDLRDALLPDLLRGRVAGATGLSNAMKFLSGLEDLQIDASGPTERSVLNGKMPWVTNLRPQGFHVAAAVARADGGNAFVASLAEGDAGLVRSPDLDLMALCGTNTAAISLAEVSIAPDRIIHPDAKAWLPTVRPAFLGLQCGMSIGLARRSLAEARRCAGAGRQALTASIEGLSASLSNQAHTLRDGLQRGTFITKPAALFEIRIALAEIVAQAVWTELQASGGRAYLATSGAGFERRWRETAFIPIVTPSLVQLKAALDAQTRNAA